MIVESEAEGEILHNNSFRNMRIEQFRFYRLFEKGSIKKPLKPVVPNQLRISLGDAYTIFIQFVQLLLLGCDFGEKIYISKALAKVGGQVLFFILKGWSAQNGFREVDKDKWKVHLMQLMHLLRQVELTEGENAKQRWVEWQNWVQQRCGSMCQESSIKKDLISFLSDIEQLKVSKQYNINVRLSNYLITQRTKHNQSFTNILTISKITKTQMSPSQHETQTIYNHHHRFKQTIQLIKQLVKQLQHHKLIERLNNEDSLQTIEDKDYSLLTKKQKIEQSVSFKLKISKEAPNQPELFLFKNLLAEAKKWMQVDFVLQEEMGQIKVKIKTMPLWKIYSQQFIYLKEVLDGLKVEATKWLINQEVNLYLFDLMRLELRSGNNQYEVGIGLEQTLKVLASSPYSVNTLVLGGLQRQLMLWGILQEYMENSTALWMNEGKQKEKPMLWSNFNETVKSLIVVLNQEIKILIKKEQ